MKIPESFFQDEVRDGFFIPSIMKHAWAAQLVILEEIARICKKHGISWYMEYGTLLGAARHKGFIPWDDDLDIGMVREEYDRFIAAAEKDLKEPFHFSTVYNDPTCDIFTCYVYTTGCPPDDEAYLKRLYGFPLKTGIDIFVLEDCPDDHKGDEARWLRSVTAFRKAEETIDPKEHDRLMRLTADIFSSYRDPRSRDLIIGAHWLGRRTTYCRRQWFSDTVFLPFEFLSLPAPAGYRDLLKVRYGEDYMTPSREEEGHHYPSYKYREKEWREKYDRSEFTITSDLTARSIRMQEEAVSYFADKGSSRPKIIFFLPEGRPVGRNMGRILAMKQADPATDVHLIRVPVQVREKVSLSTPGLSGADVPLPVDIGDLEADEIWFSYPYDGTDGTFTIPEAAFASNLRRHTPNLFYVPDLHLRDFTLDEVKEVRMMKHYTNTPAVLYADAVAVSSEQIRRLMTSFLVRKTGEVYLDYWYNKFQAI